MVKATEYMAGIEIDRYAMIGFEGVRHLVAKIGGVDIRMSRPLVDTYLHVVMNGKRGLRLKKGKNHLTGPVALAFARTRHADNDYERGRRQQQLIAATVQKVLKNGSKKLPALLKAFKEKKFDTGLMDGVQQILDVQGLGEKKDEKKEEKK